MSTQSERKRRGVAVLVSVLFHAGLLILLLALYLRAEPLQPRVWPPEDTSELLLDGEYVRIGDIAAAQDAGASASSEQQQESTDPVDAGTPAPDSPAPVTAEQESPMKQKPEPVPEKTGPTREEREAADRARREAEAKKKINDRMKFGSGSQSSQSGTAPNSGSVNGNSSQGASSGKPGHSLAGRSLADWSKPVGHATGTITVSVRVNRQGQVVSAAYRSGTGDVASDRNARSSCEQAALASRFSVNEEAPAEQTGTITYRFE